MKACKWTDEVVPYAPYVTEESWIDSYGCQYVVHGDDISTDADGRDCYEGVKKAGRFLVCKRTEGISTTGIPGPLTSLNTCRSRWTNAALHTKPLDPSSIQYLHRTQHPRKPRPLQLPSLRRRTRNPRLPLPKLHLNPPRQRHPPHKRPKSHLRRRNIRSLHSRPHRTPPPDPRIYSIALHHNRSPRRLHNQQNQGIQLPDHEYPGTSSRCPAM